MPEHRLTMDEWKQLDAMEAKYAAAHGAGYRKARDAAIALALNRFIILSLVTANKPTFDALGEFFPTVSAAFVKEFNGDPRWNPKVPT